MTGPVSPGHSPITPSFTFADAKRAIDFYKKAFNAEVLELLKTPSGHGILHAALKIGDALVMVGDRAPWQQPPDASDDAIDMYLYVEDADATCRKAVAAGAVLVKPLSDTLWGDRTGGIRDPFGYAWMIASHQKSSPQAKIVEDPQRPLAAEARD